MLKNNTINITDTTTKTVVKCVKCIHMLPKWQEVLKKGHSNPLGEKREIIATIY